MERVASLCLDVTVFDPERPARAVRKRTFFDTGATTSCVKTSVVRDELRLPTEEWQSVWAVGTVAESSAPVYRVGLTVHGNRGRSTTIKIVRVLGLESYAQEVGVLIGLQDIIRGRLTVDGPGRMVVVDFP